MIFRILGLCLLVLSLWSLVSGLPAMAGGPFLVNAEGVAVVWDNSTAVAYHPESGSCGSFSNDDMLTKIGENLSFWSGIDDITLSFDPVTDAIGSVDGTNYSSLFTASSDCGDEGTGVTPVVFDDDGEITDDIFGNGNRFSVLGFAGPATFNDDCSEILEGQAFFNCRCQTGSPSGSCPGGVVFTEDDLNFTIMHEFGHLLGLDHTQVNQSIAEGNCDSSVAGDCDAVPAMYPQSVDAEDQMTPSRDDQVAALTLYGGSTLASNFCTVSGTLNDANGDPLRCADIQAETGDSADTIAVVSGASSPQSDDNGDGDTQDSGECLSNCGDFILRGLDPSKSYTITIKPIDSQWRGGSGINPCNSSQLDYVEEEEIATIAAGDCAGGATLALETITTISCPEEECGAESDTGGGCSCVLDSRDRSGNGFIPFFISLLVVFGGWKMTGQPFSFMRK
ncbi:MAG: hypothetical protein HY541_00490 [Deltaproteobacteria bacterium]|nr:hypothetical protein [Deltaproteobacteria bacterium]